MTKLEEIFSVVLKLPPHADFTGVRRINEPRWDSLAHTMIMAAVESEFGICFDVGDVERITSYESARLLIEEKMK